MLFFVSHVLSLTLSALQSFFALLSVALAMLVVVAVVVVVVVVVVVDDDDDDVSTLPHFPSMLLILTKLQKVSCCDFSTIFF